MKDAIANGAFDGRNARLASAALARDEAVQAQGPTGVAKVKERKKNRKTADLSRKRKKRQAGGLVQKLALLTEEGVALLGRLGCGAEELGLGNDGPGELIDADSFPDDAAALQKLIDDEEDAIVIKKKREAIRQKVGRARKKAKLEKDQERAKELSGRVEELETEVCLLEDALSVI